MALSTGSPASRRLTKLTPFTTRPAVTSRQGMIRLVSILELLAEHGNRAVHPRRHTTVRNHPLRLRLAHGGQRVLEAHRAVVERLADDRAFRPQRAQAAQ